MSSCPKISVIVPVLNEERTISTVLDRLNNLGFAGQDVQIIVVDDGSTDGTRDLLAKLDRPNGLIILRHATNLGKGAAFRTALAHATGLVSVVQDADLEYDPAEIPGIVKPLLNHEFEVVYGSRYMRPNPAAPWNHFRLAVVAMNWLVWLLYGRRLTDIATCYKALPTELYRTLDIQSNRFELCAEVTAKLCRLNIRIKEMPISYYPRSKAEGKKIGWRDAFAFAWTLIAWRFRRLQPKWNKRSPAPIALASESIALPASQRAI